MQKNKYLARREFIINAQELEILNCFASVAENFAEKTNPLWKIYGGCSGGAFKRMQFELRIWINITFVLF